MPKWDKTRDYYADLELSASASTEEVKKQFKKLALKYHPDRNPGREAEVNPKFQTIQSAHEILSDETLRRQYDDARRTYSIRNPRGSGVRGNPWQDIAKQYPPPPTRHTTQRSPTRAHSGAQRYTSFTTNMPRAAKATPRDDPQSRKSYADAWENMRPNASRRAPPQTPGRAPTSAARNTKPADPEPVPPRTAYQQQKAQASFGSRRTGFIPRSPGQADEPPVTNKNYFTTRTHPTMFTEVPFDTTPADSRTSTTADPLAQFREKVWDERQSMPYHSPGGEKTSLFDDVPGIGRTTSTRSPRKAEMPGAFPQSRTRSSSTPRSSSNDGGSEDSRKVGKGTKPSTNQQVPSGNSTFQSRFNDRYKQSAEANGVYPPPRPGTAETPPTTNASKSGPSSTQTTNGPSVYAPLFPSPSSSSNPQHHYTRQTNDHISGHLFDPINASRYYPAPQVHNPSSGGIKLKQNPYLLPVEEKQRIAVDSLINNRSNYSRKSGTFSSEVNDEVEDYISPTKRTRLNTDQKYSSSFTFPTGSDIHSQGAGLTRNSADSINTRFVDDELPEDWKFSAGTASASDPQTPTRVPTHSRSRGGRRQVPRSRHTETDSVPSTQNGGVANGVGLGFSPWDWSDKIETRHFEPQPPRSTSSSPSRRANLKKSKPVKMTAGTAGLVDEEESEGWQEVHQSSGSAPANVDTATAMDIDSPPSEKSNDTPKVSQMNGARKIPVEPHREEWRAGNVNDMRAKSTSPTRDDNSAKGNFAQTSAPEAASIPAAHPFVAQHGGSEDTDEFCTTFSDFKKVEPFVDPAPRGLGDFGDLKTTLPFQSKPSEHIPLDKDHPPKPTTLEFPAPPVAPRLPQAVLTAGIRPNQVQFSKYAQDFYQYMDKWESFNARIMAHFTTRQENFKIRRQQRGVAWLDTSLGGSDAARDYLAELEQDQVVRQQWLSAHADHQAKIREFMMFRDQVK
ncbi:DnaJ-related protein rsp1 [Daldinia childiae]|uniref:DnaJ-related protein rsp1 n=1 Tax=Daldinia childiae TaxID=326645 RepID=UPI001445BDFA|nr:DnaJ-related protein rsp1 [Daldinia childiae]KAF3062217.1 DnaJ-related protein rsp1 [Daldinia childiae]